MLVTGAAGFGRTEALAAGWPRLAAAGTPPEQVLVLARSRGRRQADCGPVRPR